MHKIFFLGFILTFSVYAETNSTQESNATVKKNLKDKTVITKKLTEQQVKEQMAREAEYAKSQSFAQGDDYDLKAVEVNVKSLDNIPSIEPDYDFDMTDVYRDDL
jgi:hypothetical protein